MDNTDENIPYFLLVGREGSIGTPRGFASTEHTVDVAFRDLAQNYELQEKLKMLSAVLIRPHMLPPVAYPMEGRELIEGVATYLSAFAEDPEERRNRRDYLLNDGRLRICSDDQEVLEAARKVAQSA